VVAAGRVIPPSRYNRPWRPLDWRNSIEVSTRLASIKLIEWTQLAVAVRLGGRDKLSYQLNTKLNLIIALFKNYFVFLLYSKTILYFCFIQKLFCIFALYKN